MKSNKFGLRRWEGYTLEDLRNQRTIVNTRIMVERCRLADEVDTLRDKVLTTSRPNSMMGRMFSALSYLDWIMLGVTLWRRLSPLFVRRHRR